MIRPENRRAAGDAADLIEAVVGALGRLGEIRTARDALTASATVEHGRITVTVNASGSILRTEYAEGIDELSYGQIARATVQAAQQAAAKVQRQKTELMAPLTALRSGLRPEDLSEELADLRKQLPEPARAPLTPPSERDAGTPHSADHRILDR
ncbi:YbaB/EbfC family nucleoid-associated protein [Nocardia sp. NPDC057030]|uniref:YbaB/EbfC family nucleoid-associated protein n=1 Tax=unclassified Nocardia TaxID=2637762 RepID=UPI00363B567A